MPFRLLLISLALLPLNSISAAPSVHVNQPLPDFPQAEAHEFAPGGRTSQTARSDAQAFSQPAANMSAQRKLDFSLGKALFERPWASSPASTQAADGLGPLYNARSCVQCHQGNGRGQPTNLGGDIDPSLLIRLSIPPQTDADVRVLKQALKVIPEPTYGQQLQPFAVRGLKAEGRIAIRYTESPVEMADGETASLRQPSYRIMNLGYGPMHPDTRLSPRLAPQLIGLGLLEAIDEKDLRALADPDDLNGDGISGRINRVWNRERQQTMPGRFGWKAGMASVNEQSQAAFNHDIGLSTPLYPDAQGDCTADQTTCLQAPNGNSPQYDDLELHQDLAEWTAHYVRHIAVPQRRDPNHPQVLRGKRLFYQANCVACHTPKFRTRNDAIDPENANQLIWPYTDLLLHDMGEGLADNRPEADANAQEWRTAPLWGIGLSRAVNGHANFLHDGRARSVLEAILWHGGEAKTSRDRVTLMTRAQRADLIRFIESL